MHALTLFANAVLTHLLWASVQAVVLVGLLWLVCRLLPRLPATIRTALWWLVAAQLLVGLASPVPVSLPVLAPATATGVIEGTAPALPATRAPAQRAVAEIAPHPLPRSSATATPASQTPAPWRETLLALWMAGLLVQLALVGRQWRRARYLRRTSRPVRDLQWLALCGRLSHQLGIRVAPELRISGVLQSLQVSGLVHPVVLLPDKRALAPEECAMALAHELAHVRRRDLWWGWAPIAARTLFFFHPLVHFAVREYALHREAACDSLALRLRSAAPRAYGELLVRLGVDAPMAAGLAGMASPSFRHLKRRLVMLQQATRRPRLRDWTLVAAVALAFIVPYRAVRAHHNVSGDQREPTSAASSEHWTAAQDRGRENWQRYGPPPVPASLIPAVLWWLPPSAKPRSGYAKPGANSSNASVYTQSIAGPNFALPTNGSGMVTSVRVVSGIAGHLYRVMRASTLWIPGQGEAYVAYAVTLINAARNVYSGVVVAGRPTDGFEVATWSSERPATPRRRSVWNSQAPVAQWCPPVTGRRKSAASVPLLRV